MQVGLQALHALELLAEFSSVTLTNHIEFFQRVFQSEKALVGDNRAGCTTLGRQKVTKVE